jgi:hypothetical protein
LHECHIQDAANAAILGTSMAESHHSNNEDDDLLSNILFNDASAAAGGNWGCGGDGGNGSIQFSEGGNDGVVDNY